MNESIWQPTRQEFEVADECGYRFRVVAERDECGGWMASVTMKACGYRTPEAAVGHLRDSLVKLMEFIDIRGWSK